MKSHWIDSNVKYDGSQLQSLFAYLNHQILGDSIVSWVGPCDVTFDHMVDGEDLLQKAEIKADKMLHFIVEKFDIKLFSGVCLQRLLGEIFIMDNNNNTICINNQLITEGHAYVYEGGKKKLLKEVNNG